MAFLGRTPHACFDALEEHVRTVVARTVTTRYPIFAVPTGRLSRYLCFRDGQHATTVPIQTTYGRLYFAIGQAWIAEPTGPGFSIGPIGYFYRIQRDADAKSPAIVRWEYAPDSAGQHSWLHTQVTATVAGPRGDIDLGKWHLPMGPILFEDIIRFLIADLGVEPLCGRDQWEQVLRDSESRWFQANG